ncbi:putative glycerophosphodiester phosphodiesterase [Hibiscus syriacus]|uniref:Glycerophosphodiester phosphodiesterase n=1 Tax=Hibiscus syriacus TaxID=106335 RepID=A0A6A2ZW44_HIBSY|nr:NAC domain-containing protein 83-like [Hibiscus syriacus]KAE8696150.1 putative glycerophosphodiester phosphodiesterase [Hibiscus syriacus]
MESGNFVVNGGIKMPIGFRFHPTDEELVVHYLKRKALYLPLPASVIPEFNVLHTDPRSFSGDSKENKYFFSTRDGDNGSSKKRKRIAGSGYWKPVGKEKPILASGTNEVIGMRKTLIFSESECSDGTETRWVLHQYRLVDSVATLDSTQMSIGDWLVFRVFQKKRNKRRKNQGVKTSGAVNMASCIDFTVEDRSVFGPPPQPTSPSSSHGLDEEDENSGLITSYSSCLLYEKAVIKTCISGV